MNANPHGDLADPTEQPVLCDASATIEALRQQILAFVREREWEVYHSPKNLSMALAAEAAELMELFQWLDGPQSVALCRDPAKREAVAEEIADVVIYALEFAHVAGIDVAAAIGAKMAKNAAKYPVAKARGNARKYTEL
jgi:dCTP diphosphatase